MSARRVVKARRRWAPWLAAGALLWGCEDKLDPKAHADGLYLAALAAFQQGKHQEALERFKQMEQLAPEDPRLPAALGELYLEQKKLPDALWQFERARKLEPKRATTWGRIGYIHLLEKRDREAEQALKRALELNPRHFYAYDDLATLSVRRGDGKQALAHFAKAAQLAPAELKPLIYGAGDEALRRAGFKAEARVLLEDGREANALTTSSLLSLGDQQVEAGALDAAVQSYWDAAQGERLERFARSSRLSPQRARAVVFGSGVASLRKAGAAESARQLLERGQEGDGLTPSLWVELGDLRVEAGDTDGALAAYREAATREAKDPTPWELVGELEIARGNLDAGVEAFQASLRVQPTAVVHLALARVCLLRRDRRCSEAELERALSVATGADLREVLGLADMLTQMGRDADALKLLAGVAEEPQMEENPELQLRRAQVAARVKDDSQRVAACKALMARDGGQPGPLPRVCRAAR